MENKIIQVAQNRSHVWGSYKEAHIDETHILRSVRIYEDAYNSLHHHEVDEVQLVESGEILYHYMENEEMKSQLLYPGSVTFVPSSLPHRIEFVGGEFSENGVKFAQISEIVLGNNRGGHYPIVRISNAKPGKNPHTPEQ